MVRGNILSSNKSALANEGAITETGGGLNYPRNYHETYKNMQTVTDLFDNGVVEEVVLDTLEWAKPRIIWKNNTFRQRADSSYLSSGIVLEFNIIFPGGQYTGTADLELVLPVRLQDPNGKKST